MDLKGKVINFLGDSITAGAGASCQEKRYTDVFAREFLTAKVNNYGLSGSRIARQKAWPPSLADRDYCMRMDDMDPSADAVVVFGGTNDFGHGDADLGTPEDREPSTFWGACHTLMNGLLTRYPGKPVLIVTPLHRNAEDSVNGDGSKPGNGAPLNTYRKILMEAAEIYGLPVLDLYATSGIQPLNPVCREHLLPDGLHPSDEGHAIISRRIGMMLQLL